MRNSLDEWLQNTRHDPSEITRVAKHLVTIHGQTCKTLKRPVLMSPLHRLNLACVMFSSVADGIDPDISYLAAQSGVPRSTLCRRLRQRVEIGDLELERDGRRTIVAIDGAVPDDIGDLMDYMVDHHQGTGQPDACPNCGAICP